LPTEEGKWGPLIALVVEMAGQVKPTEQGFVPHGQTLLNLTAKEADRQAKEADREAKEADRQAREADREAGKRYST
jgi:hypothetical protein